MDKEKAERIQRIFNWVRFIILVLFLAFVFIGLSKAQTTNDFGMWISAGTEKKVTTVGGLEQTPNFAQRTILEALNVGSWV